MSYNDLIAWRQWTPMKRVLGVTWMAQRISVFSNVFVAVCIRFVYVFVVFYI